MGDQEIKKRVLIVDDEEDMIWSLQKNLPTDSLPVSIKTASSGEEALTVLKKHDVDLIVTDIKMPGMSGIDLLIEVRNTYPDTGVLVMTAFPSSESKAEVIEKGGLRFIEKPFDIKEMRGFIRSALDLDSHIDKKAQGIQLIDIVQVNNFAKATNALRITDNGRDGVIYFVDGAIVHAICGDLVGEEAFYSLMCFQGGKIDTFYPDSYPETTINTPVGALMLKGTLLSEEAGRNVDYLEELDLGIQSEVKVVKSGESIDFPAAMSDTDELDEDDIVESEPVPDIVESDSDNDVIVSEPEPDPIPEDILPSEKNNDDKEDEMEELKELLGEFTNIPGVNTACLVGRDGFLLHSVALSGLDSEMIGAIASSGFGASEAMGNQLEKGKMSMTMVEYENGPVMLAPVGSEAFLVIVADKDANLGMIRLKIKKHSRDIEQKAGI